jgi:hypothetical protein
MRLSRAQGVAAEISIPYRITPSIVPCSRITRPTHRSSPNTLPEISVGTRTAIDKTLPIAKGCGLLRSIPDCEMLIARVDISSSEGDSRLVNLTGIL